MNPRSDTNNDDNEDVCYKMLTGMTKAVGMCYYDMLTNYCDYDVVHCVPKVNNIFRGLLLSGPDIAKKV